MPQPAQRFHAARLPALLYTTLVVGLVLLLLPAGAFAGRDVPVGMANTNDQNLSNSHWLYSIRFVLDRDTTMYRFFSQMKAKGASWDEHGTRCTGPGAGCYAAGDGGRINARLVRVKADGTPDLSSVLAQETIDPRTRYFETKSAYGVTAISLFWYYNMGGVQLKANTPYAMVYRNVHADPAHNFSSTNSPVVKESESGPNGRNNLDPNAPGAIAGLDPREAVAWSTNDGASWSWGRQVGHYFGSASTDDGTRLPHYAWQTSATTKPQSNQPYMAYWGTCTPCTLTAGAVPRRTTFTEAGGYAPVGKSVGVVTVRNLRTGQSGHTAALGSGIRRGALTPQVTVEVGDSYQITHTGTVYKQEADAYLVQILALGSSSGAFPFTTTGHGADRAELFALPHPYYLSARRPAPAPRGRTRRLRRARHDRVRVRTASFTRRHPGSRRRRVVGRLTVRGRVIGVRGHDGGRPDGGRGHGGGRVRIQIRRNHGWRTVGSARMGPRGRYVFRRSVTLRRRRRGLTVRVVVPAGASSRAVRVQRRGASKSSATR